MCLAETLNEEFVFFRDALISNCDGEVFMKSKVNHSITTLNTFGPDSNPVFLQLSFKGYEVEELFHRQIEVHVSMCASGYCVQNERISPPASQAMDVSGRHLSLHLQIDIRL